METSIFFTASVFFIALTFGLFGLIVYGLNTALTHTNWETGRKKRILYLTVTGFVAWFVCTGIVAYTGFLQKFDSLPPRLVIILLPPLIFIIILSFSASVTQLLQRIPPAWLIGIQSFRILMEIILWMAFIDDIIPVQMTFEGRNYDILVGLTAPVIVYFCFIRKTWPAKVAIAWNIAGLILLANIVLVSVLSAPVPFRMFMNEPANTFVVHLPFVWLPAFVVPIAYWMHILSLKQLRLASKVNAKDGKVVKSDYMLS